MSSETTIENVKIVSAFAIRSHVSIWRRLWFLASAVPHYLISGSIEVP